MDVLQDPERNEINALLEYAGDLAGKRVLEIGAGKGRLTWRYAAHADEVVGLDPSPERIAAALSDMPEALHGRVAMVEATLEEYHRDARAALFDMALMSWSL